MNRLDRTTPDFRRWLSLAILSGARATDRTDRYPDTPSLRLSNLALAPYPLPTLDRWTFRTIVLDGEDALSWDAVDRETGIVWAIQRWASLHISLWLGNHGNSLPSAAPFPLESEVFRIGTRELRGAEVRENARRVTDALLHNLGIEAGGAR